MTKQQTAAQISVCYKQHSPNEFTHRYIWKNVQLDHDFSVFRCAISAATLSTTMMMTRYVWQISKNLERNKQTKKTIKKEQQHTHTRTKHLRNALRMISENKTTFNRHPWRKGCAFLSYFGMNTNLTRKKIARQPSTEGGPTDFAKLENRCPSLWICICIDNGSNSLMGHSTILNLATDLILENLSMLKKFSLHKS